jgi:hypothetical protein
VTTVFESRGRKRHGPETCGTCRVTMVTLMSSFRVIKPASCVLSVKGSIRSGSIPTETPAAVTTVSREIPGQGRRLCVRIDGRHGGIWPEV